MSYRVITVPQAKLDQLEIARWIAADSPFEASRWLDRLRQSIETLMEFPNRCPIALVGCIRTPSTPCSPSSDRSRVVMLIVADKILNI